MAGDCKILLGGEHDNERILNNTMGNFPFLRSNAKKAGMSFHPSSSRGAVHIGHNVVISQRVMIRSGVTIDNGAVIGAGAVVTHDIPAFAIAAGVPARLVKKRFDEESIAALLALRWWDWELLSLSEHLGALHTFSPLEMLEYSKKQSIMYEERSDKYVVLSAIKQDSIMNLVCEGVEINRQFIPLSQLPENFQLYIAQAHAKHGQEIMIMHHLFSEITVI